MKKEQDLTEGSLAINIFKVSLPLVCTNILQVLFNMSDIAVVGKFAGPIPLGGVGSTSMLVNLFTGILIGLGAAVNVITALYLGGKEKKNTKETVDTSFVICLSAGIILLLIGTLFGKRILIALNTKDELLDAAVTYFRIYCIGMPALGIYNFGSSVLSGAGNTKKPLLYLLFSGILNVFLNLFFVVVCHMDADGVAVASIISQYISAFLILRLLIRTDQLYQLDLKHLTVTKAKASLLLRLGLPSSAQNAIFYVANLFVQLGINSFDAVTVEGISAASNADNFIYDMMAAFYATGAAFMSQNIGAKKKDRILKSYFLSMGYAFSLALLFGCLLVWKGNVFLHLFTSEKAVIEAGMERLRIMGFAYCLSAFMDATIAGSRAFRKTTIPTIIVILGSCIFRIFWIYTIFAHYQTTTALYLLYPFSWSITAIAEIIYFIYVYKAEVKTIA